MTVSFGKVKTAFYGQTRLTKVIHRNGFGLITSLDIGHVRKSAMQTCKGYPAKKQRFTGFPYKPIITTKKGVEVIAYGFAQASKKTGVEVIGAPCWALALGSGIEEYKYRIILASARLHSGQIDEIEELEFFLNELIAEQ